MAIGSFAGLLLLAAGIGAPAALADPVATGSAGAFGATATLAGSDLIPPTPEASVAAPTADDTETVIDIPVAPVVVNGTLTATANVHATSDIPSGLTVVQQATPGPYNARGLAVIENLELVYEVAGAGVPLVAAAAVRAEAAAVCSAGTVTYTAGSEIIDLAVADTDIPLNAPVQDIVDLIGGVLADSGLNAVVDVQRNVVTNLAGGGIAVDALVVTVLAAAGEAPLAQVRLAHAEVGPTACGPPPECSDTADNDGDGVSDADDPGCHTDGDAGNPDSYDPNDDSEAAGPACSDGVDNDGDGVSDTDDPGCHTDGDAGNPASYDPNDTSEQDAAGEQPSAVARELPRTGGVAGAPLAVGGLLTAAGLGLAGLRRRFTSI